MTTTTHQTAVIGLGPMGAALAQSLLDAGTPVRVWNRSPEKAEPLADAGAIACATPVEAITGCSTVVVCLANYSAWRAITDDALLLQALKGVVLIQLTGGTMAEVEAHAALMDTAGARLVEAAIMCFPEQIGTPAASFIMAGKKEVIEQADPVLRIMSPRLSYLGETYTAPVVLGRAAISNLLGQLIGTVNGAAICQAGGVPLSAYYEQLADNGDLRRTEPQRIVEAIAAGQTEETQAALATWADGHLAVLDVSEKLGIATEFHDGIKALFEKSRALGLGEHDLSAMVAAFTDADR